MRYRHITGGAAAFCAGTYLVFLNPLVVGEFLKSAGLLVALLLGVVALFAAAKSQSYGIFYLVCSGLFLIICLYGIFLEYYLIVDFLSGLYPIICIILGGLALLSSLRKALFTWGGALVAHLFALYEELRTARNEKSPYLTQSIIGGVAGNVLEWYDFAVFGYFAPFIATQFFPHQNQFVSLLSTYGVFAGAYFIRPLGGVLFGYIGDRYGRKKALMLSVLLMAIPTGLIGLLPTHAQIGSFAAVLLVILRLAQGLSVGGELIGSISFVTEIAPARHRGFFGSWTFCGVAGGIMFGSLAATIAHNVLEPADLESWGWRIPFILGIVIGGLGLWMRSGLSESPEFVELKNFGRIKENPVVEVIYAMPWRIVQVAALVVLSGGGFYLLFVWWPIFLSEILAPPVPNALFLNTLSMLVLIALTPLTGAISDIAGRRSMHILGAAGVAIAAYPMFVLVGHATVVSAITAQLIFTVLISIFMGPVPATMVELFPPDTRFSGTAVGYNISLCIFGGTAPLVGTWLVVKTGSITAPAYYLIFMALISLVAAISLQEKDDDLTDFDEDE